MALAYKIIGANVESLHIAAAWQDTNSAVSAAGTNQATATELTNADNYVSSVSANQGVKLSSQAFNGDEQTVYNGTATALFVYPPSGAKINQLSTNAAMTLTAQRSCRFKCISTTQWVAILSA